ncbi:metallophosphoesterase [Sphingobacterium sp. LRF_L2]|uniref:metallophosphoesterase n=1 Tax=Sphingobacterium sp. LRF_L2 TaxID=3369421 RepID=UPI003F6241C7
MKNFIGIFLLSFLFYFNLLGQEDVLKRIILIGDAGEINHKQETLLERASDMILSAKTTVFFLGDNIYPLGMPVDTIGRKEAEEILMKQFTPFREKIVPVYFLAGNHDWDKSGPLGLEKVIAQEDYLYEQKDPDLHFVPKAGKLGPIDIRLGKGLTAIVYDSEYWVFPHHKQSDHEISLEKNVFFQQMDSLLKIHKEDIILILAHHPMLSYGEHGLKFAWKQHVFPLTAKWRWMYVTLPVVGSIYPVLRSTVFSSAEDQKHPIYRDLIKRMTKLLHDHPNVILVSGHDHGLQYIESDNLRQIVSGSGAKTSMITNAKDLLFRYEKQGFCILDYYSNGHLNVKFYTYEKGKVYEAYNKLILPR